MIGMVGKKVDRPKLVEFAPPLLSGETRRKGVSRKNLCWWLFVVTPYMRIRRKSKESNEIDRFGWRKFAEIRRQSHWQSFFAYVITGLIGFQRVVVLTIGLVRKGPVDDSRFRIFCIYFTFLDLTVRIHLFKCTHTDPQKSELIFI